MMRWFFHIRWLAEAILLSPLLALMLMVPKGLVVPLARRLGRLAYHLLPRERQRCLTNLEMVYGANLEAHRRRQLAKAVFEHHALTLFEIVRMNKGWLASNVRVEGCPPVSKDDTSPIVVIGGHLGNWEVLGGFWKQQGITCRMIARPLDNPYFEWMLKRRRASYQTETVSRRGMSLRQGIRWLRGGGTLGFAIDQNAVRKGVFVDFLGYPASTARGAAVLALRTKARVFVVVSVREADHSHRVVVDPVDYQQSGDFEQDVDQLTARFASAFEQWVLQYPEQWHWQHARWNTRPNDGEWTDDVPVSERVLDRCRGPMMPPVRWLDIGEPGRFIAKRPCLTDRRHRSAVPSARPVSTVGMEGKAA